MQPLILAAIVLLLVAVIAVYAVHHHKVAKARAAASAAAAAAAVTASKTLTGFGYASCDGTYAYKSPGLYQKTDGTRIVTISPTLMCSPPEGNGAFGTRTIVTGTPTNMVSVNFD